LLREKGCGIEPGNRCADDNDFHHQVLLQGRGSEVLETGLETAEGNWWEERVTAYSRLDGHQYKTSSQFQERTLQDPSQ
jgi:hypothetical protein